MMTVYQGRVGCEDSLSLAVKEGLSEKNDLLKENTIICWYYNWGIAMYFYVFPLILILILDRSVGLEPQDVLTFSPFWPHHSPKPGQDGKKKILSHLLEGRKCHLMLEILKQQETLLNNHFKKQVRIIFKQLGLGNQVLSGNTHWGEKYGRITDATCVHEICRPAPSPAPWQKPWRNFSLGTWANTVFSSKE